VPGGSLIGPLAAGVVGKLPAHGDFVRRGNDVALIGRLDRWLADELGRVDPDALDERLAALPGWGFLLTGRGSSTVGVMMASSDSVGRIFPVIGFSAAPGVMTTSQARSWCTQAAETLAAMRDAGSDASAVAQALAAIVVDDPHDDAGQELPGTLWWHAEGAQLRFDNLPTGTDFERLLIPDEAGL
jgi:type VI secretion system ImpM family protein